MKFPPYHTLTHVISTIYYIVFIYGEIFHKQANLFSRARGQVKIMPESEISCHITLISVISGLFHTRYLHCCS